MMYHVIDRSERRPRWLGAYRLGDARLVAALRQADIMPPPPLAAQCRPWRQRRSRPATVEIDHEAALVEEGLRVWGAIGAMRSARAKARPQETPPLYKRLRDWRFSRLQKALRAWCAEVELVRGDNLRMEYVQHAEWDRPWRPGRRNWPSRRYDILHVTASLDGRYELRYDRRGRLLVVVLGDPSEGRIAYRKQRGHKLESWKVPAAPGRPGDGSRLAELSLLPPLTA